MTSTRAQGIPQFLPFLHGIRARLISELIELFVHGRIRHFMIHRHGNGCKEVQITRQKPFQRLFLDLIVSFDIKWYVHRRDETMLIEYCICEPVTITSIPAVVSLSS